MTQKDFQAMFENPFRRMDNDEFRHSVLLGHREWAVRQYGENWKDHMPDTPLRAVLVRTF